MRYLEEIEMRRLVMNAAAGTPHVFCIAGKDPVQTKMLVMLFARSRTLPVTVELLPDGVTMTRAAQWTPGGTARTKRWDLDGLASNASLTFNIPPAEHHKLRLAASHKAKVMGWTIRCRLQDNGAMLVYRVEAQAASDSATPAKA